MSEKEGKEHKEARPEKKQKHEFVARIRYRNDLPPPPCPPKLVDIPIDTTNLTSSALLSDAIRGRKMPMKLDVENGMPLDLTEVPAVFFEGDESGIFPKDPAPELDEKDRELLRDPSGKASTTAAAGSVAFLRRNEYVSGDTVQKQRESKAQMLARQKREKANLDPEEILKTVEGTFDSANSDLDLLKHPRKKNLKPVESWPLIPDTKMFDMSYVTVKMVGSASLANQKRKFTESELSTALFKQSSIDDDEWMTFYVTDNDDAAKLKKVVDSDVDTKEEDTQTYRFTRVQDNDVTLENKRPEITIAFDEDNKQAKYINVAGQASLKRRRVVKHRRALVNEKNVAQIDLSLREIGTDEANARDEQRAAFDPINYASSRVDE